MFCGAIFSLINIQIIAFVHDYTCDYYNIIIHILAIALAVYYHAHDNGYFILKTLMMVTFENDFK